AAARVGRRWDSRGADAARPRAGRSRPPLAGDPARRPRCPLHDHIADGRARYGPGSGARPAHRNAEGAAAWWEPRALSGRRACLGEAGRRRASGLSRGGHAARDPLRSESPGDARHGGAGAAAARYNGPGAGDFDVAIDGTLVYVDVPGGLAANARTLLWVDRTGKEEPVAAPPHAYQHPRLSPDGTRVALGSTDQENDLYIWDLRRATLTRLTLDPGPAHF